MTVTEEAFWTDLRPLEFIKETPELQSPIAVAGYPFGGDSLSITKGIVSRVAMVSHMAVEFVLHLFHSCFSSLFFTARLTAGRGGQGVGGGALSAVDAHPGIGVPSVVG